MVLDMHNLAFCVGLVRAAYRWILDMLLMIDASVWSYMRWYTIPVWYPVQSILHKTRLLVSETLRESKCDRQTDDVIQANSEMLWVPKNKQGTCKT